MPVHCLECWYRGQFLYPGGTISRAQLYSGHCNPVYVSGHRSLGECNLMHGNHHTHFQRQYHAVPVHAVDRMGKCKFMYCSSTITRSQLYSGYRNKLSAAGYFGLGQCDLMLRGNNRFRRCNTMPICPLERLGRSQYLHDCQPIWRTKLYSGDCCRLPGSNNHPVYNCCFASHLYCHHGT